MVMRREALRRGMLVDGVSPDGAITLKNAVYEAFVSGYRVVMLVATAIALLSAIGAALLIEVKKPKGDGEGAQQTRRETAPV
jgi:hypothetical protein